VPARPPDPGNSTLPPAVARRLALGRARSLLVAAEAEYAAAHGEPVTLAAAVVGEGGEILAQERAALSLADRLAAPRTETRAAALSATIGAVAGLAAAASVLAAAFASGMFDPFC